MRLFLTLLVCSVYFGLFAQISPNDFVFTVNTTNPGQSNSNQFIFSFTTPDSIDIDKDNDGVFDYFGVTNYTQTLNYSTGGIYTVRVRGQIDAISFNSFITERDKIISVDQWGNSSWTFVDFVECDSLLSLPLDTPDFSRLTLLSFRGCEMLNSPVDHLDVSNLQNLDRMFEDMPRFNQPLSSWDVSNSISMNEMFKNCTAFNQPINNWDVSNAIGMVSMFEGATSFNQPLNIWDVDSVKYIRDIFKDATSFNQALNNWDVANVIDIWGAFRNASSFDQDLSSWQFNSLNSNGLAWFLSYSGLSVTNYDLFLYHLHQNYLNYQYNWLSAEGLKYCQADSVRSILQSVGWFITDDSVDCNITSLKEIAENEQFSFRPNPANSILQFENASIGELLQIFNLQGQLIKEEFIVQANFTLDLSPYENGVYLIRVGERMEKVMVQH